MKTRKGFPCETCEYSLYSEELYEQRKRHHGDKKENGWYCNKPSGNFPNEEYCRHYIKKEKQCN